MSNIELILAFGNLERHFFIIKKNIILALEQFIEPHSLCASKNAIINTEKVAATSNSEINYGIFGVQALLVLTVHRQSITFK